MAVVTLGVVMLLFIPGLTNLSWKKVQSNTIWGTWLLLCGSLSLVSAFEKTGVDKWMKPQKRLFAAPPGIAGTAWLASRPVLPVPWKQEFPTS
ncbi:MAG: hypothetical protein ACOY3U_07450 [Bacillota bacterium]|uniref:hypothetical protein n=1 Tax=Desulforamulus profundi TaxID=1383067 RepID=UPI001EE4F855|nr:hypothetical protein [Desulforamulus profundi]